MTSEKMKWKKRSVSRSKSDLYLNSEKRRREMISPPLLLPIDITLGMFTKEKSMDKHNPFESLPKSEDLVEEISEEVYEDPEEGYEDPMDLITPIVEVSEEERFAPGSLNLSDFKGETRVSQGGGLPIPFSDSPSLNEFTDEEFTDHTPMEERVSVGSDSTLPPPNVYEEPQYHAPTPYTNVEVEERVDLVEHRDSPLQPFKDFWTNYFNFDGKASLYQYWMAVIPVGLIAGFLTLSTIGLTFIGAGNDNGFAMTLSMIFGLLSLVYYLASIIPNLAITARRLNDGGFSRWLLLLLFTPLSIIVFVLMFFPSKPSPTYPGV